jgi:hypothetical protein
MGCASRVKGRGCTLIRANDVGDDGKGGLVGHVV